MAPKTWIVIAGLLGAAGVGLGAYGAHGLEMAVREFSDQNALPEASSLAKRLADWDTGVRYHLTHAVALFAVGLAGGRWPAKTWNVAGLLFVTGIALFCGLLYVRAFVTPSGSGILVMLGGISFIAGWLAVAVAGLRLEANSRIS